MGSTGKNLWKKPNASVIGNFRESSDLKVHPTCIQVFEFVLGKVLVKKVFHEVTVANAGWRDHPRGVLYLDIEGMH